VEPVAPAFEEETSESETPDTETPDTETPDTETPDTETPDTEQRLALGAVLADKGYDSDDLLKYVASLRAEAVIPAKKNRKVQRSLNRELYKDRNKVERFFNRVKHYRRIATRYEKTARNYMAMIHLVSTMVWLL